MVALLGLRIQLRQVLAFTFVLLVSIGAALVFHATPSYAACDVALTPPAERQPPYNPAVLRKAQRITSDPARGLIIGDSIAARWPADLLNKVAGNLTFVNYGLGADDAGNVEWRVGHIGDRTFDTVLIEAGTKTIRDGVPCGIAAQVERLASAVGRHFKPKQIVVISILPKGRAETAFREKIAETNAIMKQSFAKAGVRFIDAAPEFWTACANADPCPLYLPDHGHLTRAGYEKLTSIVQAALAGDDRR